MSRDLSRLSQMARVGHASALLVASGVVDWVLVVATAVGGFYLGRITPNKRPFQLENPDISFPYTLHETVTSRNLVIATIVVPIVTILVVSLAFVPGLTVPPGTPRSLIWRRKLWELYASLLSYAVGMTTQWFIINGLKNVCGKPRPDLLARCQPDLEHVAQFVVGGIANITSNGQLVRAEICTNTDKSILDDGFRSYPSGHSSSSAAGLGFLALFLAFKFGVVFPFFPPAGSDASMEANALSAFPDRSTALAPHREVYELSEVTRPLHLGGGPRTKGDINQPVADAEAMHPTFSARRNGAAPPLYLLVLALAPFFGSIFIAASRWFNFRHHGFDILFGYFIGATTAILSFRLYHLPFSHGAGWAWGPRSGEKAFWAGIGSSSWAISRKQSKRRFNGGDEEEGFNEAAATSGEAHTTSSDTQLRPTSRGIVSNAEDAYVDSPAPGPFLPR